MAFSDEVTATEYVSNKIGLRSRVLVDETGRAFRLHLDFWTMRGKRVLLEEIWRGRVISRDAGNAGCLVDVGLSDPIFLQTKKTIPPNGSIIDARIKSEARLEKNATAVLDNSCQNVVLTSGTGRIKSATADPFYDGVQIQDVIQGKEAWDINEQALEYALSSSFSLTGGGKIHVEPTRALIAVDVDAGGRISRGNKSHFALETNKAAVKEIAAQLSLGSLAGLVAIDFLKMKTSQENETISKELDNALLHYLGRKNQIAKMSVFGVLELSIAHKFSPIFYLWNEIEEVERTALRVLHATEREAIADRGGKFLAIVSNDCASWLKNKGINWCNALSERIGQRFKIQSNSEFKVQEFKIGKGYDT